ncbi:hypothetical protein ACED96_08225 [Clostridium thermobutyricum]|uniref:Uncharacterized protein n=2 Tax=Clostridium thermobutyricum TaxID=29372 RepID=A0A1V4SWK3_9CLOT|nr:hypothetical protein CLTHE_11000 [Clostridium thermobutyricum DSM 4928]
MSFIYYTILLFILFLILNLIMKNEEKSPKKLKMYFRIALGVFLIRYLTLLLICLLKNVETVYLFKNFVYLNYLSIPLVVLALFFIYLRFDNLSFNIIYGIGSILICLYIIGMVFSTGIVTLDINFGYIMQLKYGEFITAIIVIILGLFLVFSVIFIDKPNINKKGICSLILILIVILVENILILMKFSILPYTIISEFIFLIIVERAIGGFKKVKSENK